MSTPSIEGRKGERGREKRREKRERQRQRDSSEMKETETSRPPRTICIEQVSNSHRCSLQIPDPRYRCTLTRSRVPEIRFAKISETIAETTVRA
jgi:hypothetical protein